MSSVCRICLDGNTSLQSVKNILLRRIYKKLTNAKFDPDDARSRVLCSFCYQKLLKCHTFSQMAVRSEKILSDLYDGGLEVTQDHITEVTRDMKQHLSVSTMMPIHIDGNDTDAASQVTVKDEPLPSMDTEEEVPSADKFLEVEIFPEYCTKSELTFEEDISDRENDIKELISYAHIDESKPDETRSLTINNEPLHRIDIKEEATTKLDKLVEVAPFPELSTTSQVKHKFACHLCEKTVDNKGSLVRHIGTHKIEKPFKCNVCEKQFNLKSYLVKHIVRIHTGEKPFACNVCNKKFNRNDHLVSHRRIHTGEKPFACNECNKKFNRNDHLVSHRRIHTGEKPFACNVCEKKFNRKDHLVSHKKRTHTDEKPLACNVCDKQFRQKNHLASHKRTHTGKNIKSTPSRLAPAGIETATLQPRLKKIE